MSDKPETSEPFSLKRWSQRKLAAARTAPAEPLRPPASAQAAAPAIVDTAPAAIPEAAPLPPVESLTFDSDYSAFMQPKIDEETKRAALKKLFTDPSFNVMDGLDIYVGDYTQPDPMPAGMLEKLSAVYAMLDPVKPPDERNATGEIPAVSVDTSGAAPVAAPVTAPAAPTEVAAETPLASESSTPATADAGDAHDKAKPA